jgi:hypothetical protein
MQKNVKAAQLDAARRALGALARRIPTVQAAADTGIHQSQVSRLYRGQFTRLSPNVRTLLAYAAGHPAPAAAEKSTQTAEQAVVRAALRTWDHTPQGARALVRLLRSVQLIRAGTAPKTRRRE